MLEGHDNDGNNMMCRLWFCVECCQPIVDLPPIKAATPALPTIADMLRRRRIFISCLIGNIISSGVVGGGVR